MKTRNGFVSNSSSSSFIVQWQCNLEGDDLKSHMPEIEDKESDMGKAVSILLDFCDARVIDGVIENTTEMNGDSKNRYISKFYTAMHNSVEDFGEFAMIFNMALTAEKIEHGVSRFEKLHETIEDGGW